MRPMMHALLQAATPPPSATQLIAILSALAVFIGAVLTAGIAYGRITTRLDSLEETRAQLAHMAKVLDEVRDELAEMRGANRQQRG